MDDRKLLGDLPDEPTLRCVDQNCQDQHPIVPTSEDARGASARAGAIIASTILQVPAHRISGARLPVVRAGCPRDVLRPGGNEAEDRQQGQTGEDTPEVQTHLLHVEGNLRTFQDLLCDQRCQGGGRRRTQHEDHSRNRGARSLAPVVAERLHVAERHGCQCEDPEREPFQPQVKLAINPPRRDRCHGHVELAQHNVQGRVYALRERHVAQRSRQGEQERGRQTMEDLPGVPCLQQAAMEAVGVERHQAGDDDATNVNDQAHAGGIDNSRLQRLLEHDRAAGVRDNVNQYERIGLAQSPPSLARHHPLLLGPLGDLARLGGLLRWGALLLHGRCLLDVRAPRLERGLLLLL
mmetsp:Transcript_105043/g.321934  ORF Transcript_105043/g.321934 Transcript_105043/m.321934 type:complete len:351 (-) Transcript_105043:1693-2745(-)